MRQDERTDKALRVPVRSNEQTLDAQLAKHGLTVADVGYVIHTHLHMDHVGQDSLLPNARILIQRRELQTLRLQISSQYNFTIG